jgi:hypothetical protein
LIQQFVHVELNQGLEMDITAIEVSERNMDIGEM